MMKLSNPGTTAMLICGPAIRSTPQANLHIRRVQLLQQAHLFSKNSAIDHGLCGVLAAVGGSFSAAVLGSAYRNHHPIFEMQIENMGLYS